MNTSEIIEFTVKALKWLVLTGIIITSIMAYNKINKAQCSDIVLSALKTPVIMSGVLYILMVSDDILGSGRNHPRP